MTVYNGQIAPVVKSILTTLMPFSALKKGMWIIMRNKVKLPISYL